MKKEIARRRKVTIEEATSERLQDRTTRAIQEISLVEDSSRLKGFSFSISQGILKVSLQFQIPIGTTLKRIGAILGGILTLAKVVEWLMEHLKLVH